MARVTVEDCLERIPNRFALTVLASRRARALCEGRGTPMIECNNKQAVTALREVAAGRVRYIEDVSSIMNNFIQEQRASLRGDDSDTTFLETVPFSSDGDDGEEVDDTVEELTSDLHSLTPAKKEKDDDDDDDSRDVVAASDDDDDVSELEGGDDEPDTATTDEEDTDLSDTDLDLDDPDELLGNDDLEEDLDDDDASGDDEDDKSSSDDDDD